MTLKVLLDMDGILADFTEGISRAHGRSNPYTQENKSSHGRYVMEDIWGMKPSQFWSKAEEWEFWANLPKTPEADEIVQLAVGGFGLENVAVLTAPPLSMGAVPGKRIWMKEHYPQLAKRMIFTGAKEFVAAPGRMLIDDKDSNVDGWEDEGGDGILLPRLWNRRHFQANDCMDVLRREFDWKLMQMRSGEHVTV